MTADLEPRLRAWLASQAPTEVPSALADRVLAIPAAPPSPVSRLRATVTTTWRPRPMLSATRLVAALAVVTLGTGALLFSASSGPTNGPGTSPSPVPSPSLTLRQVEPGVMKVVDDGAGHALDGTPLSWVDAGPDGTVRVLSPEPGVGGLLTVGRPGVWAKVPFDAELELAPDGTLWVLGAGLSSFDGETWTEHLAVPGDATHIEVAPDGTVWAAWIDGQGGIGKPEAGYLGPDGWHTVDSSASPATLAWSPSLAVTHDGVAWLGIAFYHDDEGRGEGQWQGLLRAGESGWVVEHPVGDRDDLSAGPMAVGPDGTFWVYLTVPVPDPSERYLARHDGDGWTVYTVYAPAEGMPRLNGVVYDPGLAVAADGTLWVAADGEMYPSREEGPCSGVLSFDGATWRRYLVGTCISYVAAAPDGTVWATSYNNFDRERAGLYVIDPEAGVAAEGRAATQTTH